MKIKPQTAIFMSLGVFAAGILLTSALGLWSTKPSQENKRAGREAYQDQYDPEDIRGSHTFSEISGLYGVPLDDLSDAFSVRKTDAGSFKCKDLKTVFGGYAEEIGTGSVKMFVAFYTGLSYELHEETYLPEAAASILKKQDNLTAERLSYLEAHTVFG